MSGVTQVPHWTQPEIILSLRIPNYNTIPPPPPPPPLLSPIPLIHFLTTTLPSPLLPIITFPTSDPIPVSFSVRVQSVASPN